jgi:hypothetical protein
MKSKPVATCFQVRGFVGLGPIGNYLLGGGVLHGNLQVKWRSTHIPQQNFQFWWICGFGAYWELFARGVVLHGNLQVKWKSNHVLASLIGTNDRTVLGLYRLEGSSTLGICLSRVGWWGLYLTNDSYSDDSEGVYSILDILEIIIIIYEVETGNQPS